MSFPPVDRVFAQFLDASGLNISVISFYNI